MLKSLYFLLLVTLFSVDAFSQFDDPSRTEMKDNAGLQGTKSGFFQTSNPVNYPAGASNWWHLLDVRHNNAANNFAMQFAGSFFDQSLYFRKTNSSPSQPWSKVVLETNGNVGIGTAAQSLLHIASASPVFTITNTTGGVGATASINFQTYPTSYPHAQIQTIDVGGWGGSLVFSTKQHGAENNPLTERLRIDTWGNVGIGTNIPAAKLNVVGQGLFSRDGIGEGSGGKYTLAISEKTNTTGNKASISFHNFGEDNGSIELSHDAGFRSIKFYDHQNLGLGIDVTGNARFSKKVGIGGVDFTRLNDYALAVNGSAIFTKVQVKATSSPWPDYVFNTDYNLRPLSEVESYIKQNNHLPEVPSAAEVEKDGQDIGATQAVLLKKIEELTLYVIDLKKEVEKLKAKQ